jgi:hypothetical protein
MVPSSVVGRAVSLKLVLGKKLHVNFVHIIFDRTLGCNPIGAKRTVSEKILETYGQSNRSNDARKVFFLLGGKNRTSGHFGE